MVQKKKCIKSDSLARKEAKMKTFFPLILLVTMIPIQSAEENQRITLESPIIKVADGKLITADDIEAIRYFRSKILDLLLGSKQTDGHRKGKYKLFDTYHDIQSLAMLEQDAHNKAYETNLTELLTQAKADFIVQSADFIESGRGSKHILIILIQEYCKKRNKPDSLLLEWAKTKEGQEATMFECRVTSFTAYYHFCTDLVNFLLDLAHSCPKAEQQFKDRVTKWSAVKKILPIIMKKTHIKAENINQIDFLKHLKERYLDQIALDEITPQVILPLFIAYVKNTHDKP